MKIPSSVVLELTYRCNHRCLFCSCPWDAPESKYPKGEELTIEQWKSVVDRMYDIGVESFSISGGEALLKEGFEEIIKYIRRQGEKRGNRNKMLIISNGRYMKDEYLTLFKENDVHLSMSLPGLTTFKQHTQVDNAKGVLLWFEKAKALGIDTTVNVTVTKINHHEVFETVAAGLLSGASSVLINRFLPGGRGLAYKDELMLTTEQLNEMLDTVEEVLTLSNRYGHVGTEVANCAIIDPGKYKHLSIGYQCAAANGFFVIDPAGQIRTCNHSPHIVGNALADQLIEDIDYWNTFAQSKYHPTQCKGCKLISICDSGCREVANILNGSPNCIDSSIVGFKVK